MKIVTKRLNHITISAPAGEHARVREFYSGILGLEEVPRPAELNAIYDLMWFKWLDFLLHIDFTPPWTQPAENRHVAMEIEDLRAVRGYLEENNAVIREAVALPDRERFYLLDPFGNYFELIEMKK
jgi:catechol 2,3-dioxygenase-like lactoylglutathione lyase family enzyme